MINTQIQCTLGCNDAKYSNETTLCNNARSDSFVLHSHMRHRFNSYFKLCDNKHELRLSCLILCAMCLSSTFRQCWLYVAKQSRRRLSGSGCFSQFRPLALRTSSLTLARGIKAPIKTTESDSFLNYIDLLPYKYKTPNKPE